MDVPNPRRILVLGPPDSGVVELVRRRLSHSTSHSSVTDVVLELTGTAPEPVDDSIAGLSHEYTISTKYYSAKVPVWLDEVTDVSAWKTEFRKDEAKEVIQAVGAFIFTFRRPLAQSDIDDVEAALKALSDVIEHSGGYGWEGMKLAVAMTQTKTPWLEKTHEEWDELCGAHGFEYVDFEAKGRNDYGEPVGMERVKEALEANDWEAFEELGSDLEDELQELGIGEDWEGGLHGEELEMGKELFGMKSAIGAGDDAGEDDEGARVEELQQMMVKMQAIKDMGSSMPEEERKRFAAKAVNNLMKDW